MTSAAALLPAADRNAKTDPSPCANLYLRISLERRGPLAESPGLHRYYSFSITLQKGTPELGSTEWGGREVVIARKLPTYLNGMASGRSSQPLGCIEYSVQRGATACAYYYYPKAEMEYGPLENLRASEGYGYYVEAVITNWLKAQGLRRVYTPGNDTSESREGQLKKVGLPVGWEVDIGEWIRKLARGIRMKTEKYWARAGRKEAA